MQLFVRRHNKDIFRISADWVFLFSSLLLASRFAGRWRTTALPLAGLAFGGLLAFMVYSGFIHALFDRPDTLLDDVRMLGSAWIFVRDTWGPVEVLYGVALLAAAVGLGVLVRRYLEAAWRWGARLEPRRVAAGWVVVNAYCVVSLAWFGASRDDPIIQLQAKHAYQNWQRSQDVLATVEALDGSAVEAAARLAETTPVRRPDIHLFAVESYGAVLWADDDYRLAREGLMRRVVSDLDELGIPMLTRFVTAPVSGGGSWMSTASALSGMRIGSHSTYWAWRRMAGRCPHLIAYLTRHDYHTLAVQPGATWAEDPYGYDEVLIRKDFSYEASSMASVTYRTSGPSSGRSAITGAGGRDPGSFTSSPCRRTMPGSLRPGLRRRSRSSRRRNRRSSRPGRTTWSSLSRCPRAGSAITS